MVDIAPFVALATVAIACGVIGFVIHLLMHKSATNTIITTATNAINAIQATASTAIVAQLASEGVELNSLPAPLRQLREQQS